MGWRLRNQFARKRKTFAGKTTSTPTYFDGKKARSRKSWLTLCWVGFLPTRKSNKTTCRAKSWLILDFKHLETCTSIPEPWLFLKFATIYGRFQQPFFKY
jgi:hypothetical protein